MFWHLKNRIKEETGNDVDLIPSIVSSNQPKLSKEKHKTSTNSVGSFTIDSSKEDGSCPDTVSADGKVVTTKDFKKLESKEEEWRKKLQKKEEEMSLKLRKLEDHWKKKFDDREKEIKEQLEVREMEKKALENERNSLKIVNAQLEENSRRALDYQKKICQYQEDIDQLQGFQTQEVAKVKHLLLVKEQEVEDKDRLLKEKNAQLKSFKTEISRLRIFEEQYESLQDSVETLRHSFDLERAQLTSKLAEKEEDVRHLKDKVVLLEERANAGPISEMTIDERVQKLLGERALFERRLEEAHLHLLQIKSSWSSKIESLETQVGRLCRQASEETAEKRQIELERDRLKEKITELEAELETSKTKVESKEAKFEKLVLEKDALEDELKTLKLQTEEKMNCLNKEIKSAGENALLIKTKLDEKKEETVTKENLIKELELKLAENVEANSSINSKLKIITEELEAEKKVSTNLSSLLEKEKHEKDEMMMRNAEISQEAELVKQELRKQELESNELLSRITELENKLKDKEKELDRVLNDKSELDVELKKLKKLEKDQGFATPTEKDLKAKVLHLENELLDKNKNLKVMQQRLADIKKTLQRELKVPATAIDPGGLESSEGLVCCPSTPSLSSAAANVSPGVGTLTPRCAVSCSRGEESYDEACDDVNFTYLKHVLMKFLTSRECEAQHLTRAVATLLKFSAEEEKLLKETLDWKMSWFGTKPDLGNGQTSKTIPPR